VFALNMSKDGSGARNHTDRFAVGLIDAVSATRTTTALPLIDRGALG
jgi:hypothetical protein